MDTYWEPSTVQSSLKYFKASYIIEVETFLYILSLCFRNQSSGMLV